MITEPSKHLVITRFNIKLDFLGARGQDPRITNNNVDWLEHRIGLFKRFCLPSLMGQSCKNFTWLVAMDPETPFCYKDRVCSLLRDLDFETRLVFPASLAEAIKTVTEELQGTIGPVITTRVDSDDALHKNFVREVQQSSLTESTFVGFPLGYTYIPSQNRLQKLYYPDNQFPSFVETKASEMKTVYCFGHHLIRKSAAYKELKQEPRWLQVVHERNLYNDNWAEAGESVAEERIPEILSGFSIRDVCVRS